MSASEKREYNIDTECYTNVYRAIWSVKHPENTIEIDLKKKYSLIFGEHDFYQKLDTIMDKIKTGPNSHKAFSPQTAEPMFYASGSDDNFSSEAEDLQDLARSTNLYKVCMEYLKPSKDMGCNDECFRGYTAKFGKSILYYIRDTEGSAVDFTKFTKNNIVQKIETPEWMRN